MSASLRIPQDTIDAQALASDPALSAWVSANAGSGKTHVLAQRVIRLLLKGTDPSKILCLTYTRAAAANMTNRVFSILSGWSMAGDEELTAEITALEGVRPGAHKLRRARQLFARALETPGGLKIQTIHAFCEAILHQFPLEANIAGHFELIDDQMQVALFSEARRSLLSNIAATEHDHIADAFATVLQRSGEMGLQDLLRTIIEKRDSLRAFIIALTDGQSLVEGLRAEFDYDSHETLAGLADSIWPLPGFNPMEFGAFVQAAEDVEAKNVLKWIVPDARAAYSAHDPEVRFRLLQSGFLSGSGTPYAERTFTAALKKILPDIAERYAIAAETIRVTADRMALLRLIEATDAVMVIADEMIARYERLKNSRGLLDFNDLIQRTVNLLARGDVGQWIQFKLDRGIDHILIDEAQDTSPAQWTIVQKLAEEFFSGFSARDGIERTVFAVGDEKQSIYSFQGAEPASFAENGERFRIRVPEAGGRFERVKLTRSFRSTEDVLTAVDRVFARDMTRRGVTYYDEPIEHKAIRDNAPGSVEIWSPLSPITVEEPDDWTQAIDHASAPAVRLAEVITGQIKAWLARGEILEGKKRLLRAGDILILVRKRDRFVHALSRALKNHGIPVAGADRLRLTSHIAVKDLVALGHFLLQPHDDLSLAAILKSPIFDLDEEKLFQLAHPRRKDQTLFSALKLQAQAEPRLADIVAALGDWQTKAAFVPAYELYAEILAGTASRPGARRNFIARLGHEAKDILDEFLSFCLAAEQGRQQSLEVILATLDGSSPDIKREMDATRDEIRIMTVHAAKGLEASVVFLVDPGSAPVSAQHIPDLTPFPLREGAGTGFLWCAGKDLANGVTQAIRDAIKEKAEAEYRRLLYVGMTRAEDRLIVCGYRGVRAVDNTWLTMVQAAFVGAEDVDVRDEPSVCAPVLRFQIARREGIVEAERETIAPQVPEPLPDSLITPLPPRAPLPRPLSPSGASALIESPYAPVASALSPVLGAKAIANFALERGTAIHRLLQVLGDLPPETHDRAVHDYLGRIGRDWPDGEIAAAAQSVLAIVTDSRFSALFAPGSRAEIAVMGTVDLGGKTRSVAGKIDRIAVTDDEVLIVDYKTNRPAPNDVRLVPEAYVLQIALYAALIAPIYPGRTIRAALLFTEGPYFVEVSQDECDNALARLAKA